MFKKMPFILAFIIAVVLLLDPYLSYQVKSIIYAASLSIESVIVFLLPIIIFGLLFKAAVNLARQSPSMIILIIAGVCSSNFISTFLSHFVGSWIYHFDLTLKNPTELHALQPYWSLVAPKLIPNSYAMILGLLLGVLAAYVKPEHALKTAKFIERGVEKILYSFAYLIPMFVAGFIVKMQYDGIIITIIKDYALVFLVVAIAQFSYISFIYFCASKFNLKNTIHSIKNILPAAITGFCTMSSATSMPLTILGVEKNALNPDLGRSVIPATVNIHLIGDCFAIPIFAYAIMKNFGLPEPSMFAYLIFAFNFVIAKFSVAAIPGGGVIVMVPILATYLGFNSEMLSLIIALYVLFDPVITSANVFGNGGFALIIEKISISPLFNFNKVKLKFKR